MSNKKQETSSMSLAADLSRREFSNCVGDFSDFMRHTFKSLDIEFVATTRNTKNDRGVLNELCLVLGPSWPENFHGVTFSSVKASEFEKLCNKGLTGEGSVKRVHYEWSPSDLEKCRFLTADITSLYFSSGKLNRYNTYGSVTGLGALLTYATDFKNAVFLSNLAATYIRAADGLRKASNGETPVVEVEDKNGKVS